MKKLSLVLFALLVFSGISFGAGNERSFTGEIMDSQCAMMGSHKQMMSMHPDIHNAKECTLNCVKMGGKFVLYDSKDKRAYQLDDQEKPKDFAGEKVKVTGTYDKASKTIHVGTIEAAS